MTVIRSPIREIAGLWWLYLVAGVLWILFGMWLLSYRVGSLVALAVLIGVTMIFGGFTEILVGPAVPIFRWLFLLAGGLSLAGGAAILVWPELVLGGWAHGDHVRSLLVLVNLAGAFAIVRGVSAIYAAFELRQVDEVVSSLTV